MIKRIKNYNFEGSKIKLTRNDPGSTFVPRVFLNPRDSSQSKPKLKKQVKNESNKNGPGCNQKMRWIQILAVWSENEARMVKSRE